MTSAMTEATTSAKIITFSEVELPPVSSVQQIKEYLEEKYDIPVCLQTLRYSSVVLKQDTSVASLRLRHGDELQVSYYAKAECQEMRRVMRWLEAFVNCVVHGREFPQDVDEEVDLLLGQHQVSTIQLHKYLLTHQWEQTLLKIMEAQVLQVLWHLCES